MEFQPYWCYSFESLLTFVVIVCYSIQHRWFLLNSTKFFLPQLKPTLLWVLESWSLISCCCHVHNGVKIYYKLASQFSYKTTISTINLLPKYLSQTRNLWQISWKCTCREILVWIQVGFDPIVVSSFQNRACHRIDNSPLFLFSMLFNELTHWNSYRLNSAINERGEERGIFRRVQGIALWLIVIIV